MPFINEFTELTRFLLLPYRWMDIFKWSVICIFSSLRSSGEDLAEVPAGNFIKSSQGLRIIVRDSLRDFIGAPDQTKILFARRFSTRNSESLHTGIPACM